VSASGATSGTSPTAHRRFDALLALAERYTPRVVETDGNYSDWRVAGPALVTLCLRALEGIFHLPSPRHRVAAECVARSLVDFGVTFAWLAAPSDDQARTDRMMRFERDEFQKRLQADRRYTETLPARSEVYEDLIRRGLMPSHLVDDAVHARIAEINAAGGPKGMPPLFDRAIEADRVWVHELPILREQPLANVYASLYAALSMTAHASVSAVDRVVIGQPPQLLVGALRPLGSERGPYDIACSFVAVVLLMASRRLGWPPEAEVYDAAIGQQSDVIGVERAIPHDPDRHTSLGGA
jgi:hypothetical protein